MTRPANLIFVMSDEHAARYAGCYGHGIVQTPNIDRLAARGARFANAYTPSPICMPARAAFATGLFPHETGYWCNATPYDGGVPSWGHALQGAGVPVQSIGKLHYRSDDVSTGFDVRVNPMHALDGIGDLFGAARWDGGPLPVRHGVRQVAEKVGPGESDYTRYDRGIADAAVAWLRDVAPTLPEPWVLYVSFVAPHFPLIAPEEFYALYPPEDMPLPKACRPEDWPDHPWIDAFRASYITDTFFDDDLRQRATAAYFGLCSFTDANLGRVLDAAEAAGLTERTRVVYASDHGDNLGVRGLWQKSNFYEESAAVPLVMAGPDLPAGRVVETPVSLVDAYPTILEGAGVAVPDDPARPGRSLIRIAAEPDDATRTVFGEYHAAGAISGVYMLRRGRWKYVHYAGLPTQLFDLEADPEELRDLARDPAHADTLAAFESDLRDRLDPEVVDARAKADQRAVVEAHGGLDAVLSLGSMGATPPPGGAAQRATA